MIYYKTINTTAAVGYVLQNAIRLRIAVDNFDVCRRYGSKPYSDKDHPYLKKGFYVDLFEIDVYRSEQGAVLHICSPTARKGNSYFLITDILGHKPWWGEKPCLCPVEIVDDMLQTLIEYSGFVMKDNKLYRRLPGLWGAFSGN